MDALHVQLDLFLTGGTYHNATCRYSNYARLDQPRYPARIENFSFSQELPDPIVGGLAKRSASITLSDEDLQRLDSPTLAAILATENPKGKRARLRFYDPESETVVNTLNGIISSIGQDYRSITIEGENPALLQNLLPVTRALDIYPSLDISQMESKDPPPIVVFGPMPRVTLGCAMATILSFTAVIGGGEADKYVYVDMTDIPNYTVASGDRLVYDLFHNATGALQALDLRCSDGTTLRGTAAVDQNGYDASPATTIDVVADTMWYRRDIDLSPLVGKTITEYMLGTDNNTAGSYMSFIANAYIIDTNEVKKVVIFDETITAVPLAYQTRNNVLSTTTAFIDRNWYYGPIRPAATGAVSVKAVYVDGRVRAVAYTFLTVNGYHMIRFSARPQATQGGVAKVQVDLNSTEFNRNPAAVAKFVWQDVSMLGQVVNAASFTTAIATYAGIGDYEKIVGGLAERKQALQLLRDLSFRGAYFDLNDNNEVTMAVDEIGSHNVSLINLGQQDDLNLRNAEISANNSLSNSIASEPKQLDFLAYRDPGLGSSAQTSYLISATRSRTDGGVTLTRESPYCGSGKMADREAGYLFKALVTNDFDIEILTGATIGKQFSLGDVVRFYSPKHYFSGSQNMLQGIRYDGKQYTLRSIGWNPALFTYTPGKVTVSRLVDATIDYSQTAPDTPTSPTFVSAVVTVGDDGAALVIEKWRVTLPTVNCTELRVLLYRTGTGQAAPFQTISKTSIVLGAPNDIEIQVPVRMVYDLEFYAYNGGNQAGFQYSLPALIVGHTAATDTSAPNIPTELAATVGTGQVVSLNWKKNLELDVSEYRVYRGPSDPPTTLIAEVRANRFVDVNVLLTTPPTVYFYAVSAVDRTENESDPCTAVSAAPVLIPGTHTSTIVPNTPSALTLDSEGTYFSADGTSIAFIEVNNPAMPTNGVVMNILFRPSGTAAWSIADQVSAGGGRSRVDDLTPGRAYQFAVQAFSVFGRGSAVSAVLSRTAPFDTIPPGVPTLTACEPFNQRVILVDWTDATASDFSEYAIYRQSFINLVDNYGFEEFEFANWLKVGTPGAGEAFIQGGVHSGARAANIVSLGTPLLVSQTVPITNGVTYTLAGWARITSRTSGTATIRVNIGNGTFVTALSLSTVGEWTFGDVTFVAAGTTANVQCFVTDGPLTAFFDDIALFAGTPNPTTKIAEVRASRFTDSQFFLVGTVYYYAISAIDWTENESLKSNFLAAMPTRISNEDLSKYTPQPLGALSLSSSGTYQSNDGTTLAFVNVSWTNPVDANRAWIEIAYRLNGNTISYLIADQIDSGTTARIDDLTPGRAYDYRVRGLSQVGVFGAASTLNNQVAPGDTFAPGQVTGLALSDHPPRGILARWTAATADDLASYQIQSARNSGFTDVPFGTLITRTAKTTELPLTGLLNGTQYFVRVRALDMTGNAGLYSATMSRIVPRNGTDDHDPGSITTVLIDDLAVNTAKIAALAVTNAKIANLAVDNAKIANLDAGKITTGLLTVTPSINGGATAIFIDNAGKIRMKMITGTPSQIVFENASGAEQASITGDAFGIKINPIADGALTMTIGGPTNRFSSFFSRSTTTAQLIADGSLFLVGNDVRLYGQLRTDQIVFAAPAGTETKYINVYDVGGTFQGRIPIKT